MNMINDDALGGEKENKASLKLAKTIPSERMRLIHRIYRGNCTGIGNHKHEKIEGWLKEGHMSV